MAEYADRNPMELGETYVKHVGAMTAEGLHAKSDIAAELAWRDNRIADLLEENCRLREALEQIRDECAASWVSDLARAALGSKFTGEDQNS